ncbi:MAG: protoporphyrinogen oxidase [Opitutales bacterium]
MGRVLIIGGGLAGLTAGHTLRQAGNQVAVLEAGTRAGGAIQSTESEGYVAEAGPNTLQVSEPSTLEWFDSIGLGEEVIGTRPSANKRYILKYGKLVAVPEGPASAIGSSLFSLPGKVRLAAEYITPSRRGSEDESVADFARRRVGREFLRYALDPMVAGVYAGDPEELSVQHAFPKVWALERDYGGLIKGAMQKRREDQAHQSRSGYKKGSYSFRLGLEMLITHLSELLGNSLHISSALTSLEWTGSQWAAGWDRFGMADQGRFDALLLTSPAWSFENLPLPDPLHRILEPVINIHYPPVACVVFGFAKQAVKHSLDGFGFLVPSCERREILGTLFSSSIFMGRAPKEHVTLTSYVGGCRQPSLAMQSDSGLRATVLKELKEIVGVSAEPTFEKISVWPQAIPQYNVGYTKVLQAITNAKSAFPTLFFAGNYVGGISLEKTIQTARSAAEKIHERMGAPLEADPELTTPPAEN